MVSKETVPIESMKPSAAAAGADKEFAHAKKASAKTVQFSEEAGEVELVHTQEAKVDQFVL